MVGTHTKSAGVAAVTRVEGTEVRGAAFPPGRRAEAGLTSHKNITRPLCVLYGPTKRPIPDSKVVTGYAKSSLAPGCIRARDACPFRRLHAGSGDKLGRDFVMTTKRLARKRYLRMAKLCRMTRINRSRPDARHKVN